MSREITGAVSGLVDRSTGDGISVRRATITIVAPLTVQFADGVTVEGVPCGDGYYPVIGDVVRVQLDGAAALVLGLAVADTWHLVGGASEPIFRNGWSNFGSGFQVARFRRMGDRVEVQGLVTVASAGGTTVFILPVSYRPVGQLRFISYMFRNTTADIDPARIDVIQTGDVVITPTGGTGNIGNAQMNCIFGLG